MMDGIWCALSSRIRFLIAGVPSMTSNAATRGFPVDRRQKLLGNYRLKNRCQLRADLVLLVRWEHIDNTLNGRCRTDGMQGGEYQMSGFLLP